MGFRLRYGNLLSHIRLRQRVISFNDLVRAIYREYPEMKANSVFRE